MSELVGVPGLEPGLNPPHGLVLPLHYTPVLLNFGVGPCMPARRSLGVGGRTTRYTIQPAFSLNAINYALRYMPCAICHMLFCLFVQRFQAVRADELPHPF